MSNRGLDWASQYLHVGFLPFDLMSHVRSISIASIYLVGVCHLPSVKCNTTTC